MLTAFSTVEVIDKRKCNTVEYHGMGNDEDGFIPDKENPLYFSNYHPTGSVAKEDVLRMLTMKQTNSEGTEDTAIRLKSIISPFLFRNFSMEEAEAFLSLFDPDENGRFKTSHIVGYLTENQ